jgi:Mg-chelatase subunit ChlD
MPDEIPTSKADVERLRRWRLVLGSDAEEATGVTLDADALAIDRALSALYREGGDGSDDDRRGGLGASSPAVARWLGDIRSYFPSSVVRVMQQDALERLGLRRMLLEPELLAAVEPDVHLVGTLLSLGGVLPARTRETARVVVRRVVEDIERRLASPLHQAVTGALNRATRTNRPRPSEIDWHRTIRANLKHYQPEYRTIVPDRVVGYARRRSALRDVILLVDQSGSMASSVVYSGVLGASLASIRALRTSMVVFDTSVVDLTEALVDPVELLFGVRLGGGTDIHRALGYAQGLVRAPSNTILVLISDLYEGGDADGMLDRVASLVSSGVRMIALLALSDAGAPFYDARNASALASLGVPCFACTPDAFPELMAEAIGRGDVATWAAGRGFLVTRDGSS